MPKSRAQIIAEILALLEYIDGTVDKVAGASINIQQQLHVLIQQQLKKFEIKDGRFVSGQDLRKQILRIEDKFNELLKGSLYSGSVKDYLDSFHTIAERNITLQKSANDLAVDMKLLTPARKSVYASAREALLGSGIRSFYQEPIKQLLMQQILTGGTISDMEDYLQRWVDGDLSGSKSPTGKPIPDLEKYVGQVARDTSHQYNGTINNVIKDKYKLDGFIYTGSLIKDSRPLCVHLVEMNREISFEELEPILQDPKYKAGRIPGTTIENFVTYRGGYNCRHGAIAVRLKKPKKPVTEVKTADKADETSDKLLSDFGGFVSAITALRKAGKTFSYRKLAKIKRAIISDPAFVPLTPDPDTGRTVFLHAEHGADEQVQNTAIGRKLNSLNYDVYLLQRMNKDKFKSADALLVRGKNIFLTEFKTNLEPTSRAIKGDVAKGRLQAPHILIDITSDISKEDLISGIKKKLFSPEEKLQRRVKSFMLFYRGKFYQIPRNQVGKMAEIID